MCKLFVFIKATDFDLRHYILSGMPSDEYVFANDLIDVLKKKHATNTYKSMVIYCMYLNLIVLHSNKCLVKSYLVIGSRVLVKLRHFTWKPVNLGVCLRAFFLKV